MKMHLIALAIFIIGTITMSVEVKNDDPYSSEKNNKKLELISDKKMRA